MLGYRAARKSIGDFPEVQTLNLLYFPVSLTVQRAKPYRVYRAECSEHCSVELYMMCSV